MPCPVCRAAHMARANSTWASWIDHVETELRTAGNIKAHAPHHLPALDWP
jgi:hypothetical protein